MASTSAADESGYHASGLFEPQERSRVAKSSKVIKKLAEAQLQDLLKLPEPAHVTNETVRQMMAAASAPLLSAQMRDAVAQSKAGVASEPGGRSRASSVVSGISGAVTPAGGVEIHQRQRADSTLSVTSSRLRLRFRDRRMQTEAMLHSSWLPIFDPWGKRYFYAIAIVTVAVLYNLFAVPLRCAFDDLDQQHSLIPLMVLDYVCDFIYIVDTVAVQPRKAFIGSTGLMVDDVKMLRRRYIRSYYFVMDIVSIIPTDLLAYCNVPVRSIFLRINRIIRVGRFDEFTERGERILTNGALVRILTQVTYLLLLVHVNACCYYFMSRMIGLGSDRWVLSKDHQGLFRRYIACAYWAVFMLTKIAEVPPPILISEYLFATVNLLVGLIVFATVVGKVASVISVSVGNYQMDLLNIVFHEVRQYMRAHNITPDLQHRVQVWLQHVWEEQRGATSSDNALDVLPETLRAEINIDAHLDTLKRVRLFQNCEPGLLYMLVNKLQLVTYNPGEYICKKGDVGKEMFIIKSGTLCVVSNDGLQTFATLTAGAIFGELALLNVPGMKMGNRRTASVRSQGYSYLFCLTKENLMDALEEYPDAKRVMMAKAIDTLTKDGLIETKTEDNEEVVDARTAWFSSLSPLAKVNFLTKKAETLLHKVAVAEVAMENSEQSLTARIDDLEKRLLKTAEELRENNPELYEEFLQDMKSIDGPTIVET